MRRTALSAAAVEELSLPSQCPSRRNRSERGSMLSWPKAQVVLVGCNPMFTSYWAGVQALKICAGKGRSTYALRAQTPNDMLRT